MGSRAKSGPPNHLIWPANGFRKCVSNYNVRQKFNFYLILFESGHQEKILALQQIYLVTSDLK